MPSPAHLISKIGDPIFAVFIGLSAAATRINREEKELGRSTQQTIDAGLRYALQGLYKFISKLTLLFNRRIGFRQGDASSKE
jgi:L-cystine uptake protein TcyP (sodium:dicarboxylate symporter family)